MKRLVLFMNFGKRKKEKEYIEARMKQVTLDQVAEFEGKPGGRLKSITDIQNKINSTINFARLERIPHNQCHIPMSEWSKIKVPALVLANKQDTIHRFEYGQAWADAIGGAEFKELTPKSDNPEQYIADLQHAIETF